MQQPELRVRKYLWHASASRKILRRPRRALPTPKRLLLAKTREAAKATDEYVHDNPWKAVGIGAAVGVIVGMLIGRGR